MNIIESLAIAIPFGILMSLHPDYANTHYMSITLFCVTVAGMLAGIVIVTLRR